MNFVVGVLKCEVVELVYFIEVQGMWRAFGGDFSRFENIFNM